jgi:hypothetical protein
MINSNRSNSNSNHSNRRGPGHTRQCCERRTPRLAVIMHGDASWRWRAEAAEKLDTEIMLPLLSPIDHSYYYLLYYTQYDYENNWILAEAIAKMLKIYIVYLFKYWYFILIWIFRTKNFKSKKYCERGGENLARRFSLVVRSSSLLQNYKKMKW